MLHSALQGSGSALYPCLVVMAIGLGACAREGSVISGAEAGTAGASAEPSSDTGGRSSTGGTGGRSATGGRPATGGSAPGGGTGGRGEPTSGGVAGSLEGFAGTAGAGGGAVTQPLAIPQAVIYPSPYFANNWLLELQNEPISCDNRDPELTCFPDAVSYRVSIQIPYEALATGDLPLSEMTNVSYSETGPNQGASDCWFGGGGGTTAGTLHIRSVTETEVVFEITDALIFDFDVNGVVITAARCAP